MTPTGCKTWKSMFQESNYATLFGYHIFYERADLQNKFNMSSFLKKKRTATNWEVHTELNIRRGSKAGISNQPYWNQSRLILCNCFCQAVYNLSNEVRVKRPSSSQSQDKVKRGIFSGDDKWKPFGLTSSVAFCKYKIKSKL